MANSLLQRVENVRQLARQVVWVHALGWFLALLVGSFLALATLDYLTRPIDLGTRWLLTLAFLAAAVAGVWRWLWNAWLFRPSLLETAQRIEQRHGELSGGLAGSVEFSQAAEADPAAGSVALRRRVISATEATIERIDLRQAINIRPQVRALTAAIGSLVLIAAWGLFDARTLGVAAGRLAIPWSTYAWPRRNHLEFVEAPQRLP